MEDREISLNAVLNILNDFSNRPVQTVKGIIAKLPPVTPQLCGDAISRKDAEKRIDEALSNVFVNSDGIGKDILSRLPSITPERPKGHWIHSRCDMYECSECGRTHTSFDIGECDAKFCPNCGADMRGEKV